MCSNTGSLSATTISEIDTAIRLPATPRFPYYPTLCRAMLPRSSIHPCGTDEGTLGLGAGSTCKCRKETVYGRREGRSTKCAWVRAKLVEQRLVSAGGRRGPT